MEVRDLHCSQGRVVRAFRPHSAGGEAMPAAKRTACIDGPAKGGAGADGELERDSNSAAAAASPNTVAMMSKSVPWVIMSDSSSEVNMSDRTLNEHIRSTG